MFCVSFTVSWEKWLIVLAIPLNHFYGHMSTQNASDTLFNTICNASIYIFQVIFLLYIVVKRANQNIYSGKITRIDLVIKSPRAKKQKKKLWWTVSMWWRFQKNPIFFFFSPLNCDRCEMDTINNVMYVISF